MSGEINITILNHVSAMVVTFFISPEISLLCLALDTEPNLISDGFHNTNHKDNSLNYDDKFRPSFRTAMGTIE